MILFYFTIVGHLGDNWIIIIKVSLKIKLINYFNYYYWFIWAFKAFTALVSTSFHL